MSQSSDEPIGEHTGDEVGTGNEQPFDVKDSNPNANGPDRAAGDMGVSSERVGPTGPGQVGTDGVLDVSSEDRDASAQEYVDTPPEQSAGGEEVNPDPPVPPVSGYPRKSPRHDEAPYDAPPDI